MLLYNILTFSPFVSMIRYGKVTACMTMTMSIGTTHACNFNVCFLMLLTITTTGNEQPCAVCLTEQT